MKRKRDASGAEHTRSSSPDGPDEKMPRYDDGDTGDVTTAQEEDTLSSDPEQDDVSEDDDELLNSPDDMEDEDPESETDEEFKHWLKNISFPIKQSEDPDAPKIGYCIAKLIDREPIRATFHRDMEEPTNDTVSCAFEIFDRWGNLKSELRNHPVKKGTGVWGPELDCGRILLIEQMSARDEYQRQGFGRKAFDEVWQIAQTISARQDEEAEADDTQPTTSGCEFALVWATVLNTRDVRDMTDKLSEAERDAYYTKKRETLEAFWRAMGFRRIGSSPYFGFAKDPNHPSRLLASHEDYKRPAALRYGPKVEGQDFPYNEALMSANDSDTKRTLESRLESHPAAESSWLSTDREGSNILHIVARDYKATALSWLLAMPFALTMQVARNLEGETPLEALETRLEQSRSYRDHGQLRWVRYDVFAGFNPDQVACLSQLKGLANPSPIESLRLTFGCTCHECICGFLSPRTAFAVEFQAGYHHEIVNGTAEGHPELHNWYDSMEEHLPQDLRSNFRTNKSVRQGFVNILGYITESLQAKRLPIAQNVLEFAESEWPPHTRNFLQRSGTVLSVVQRCFDWAIDDDLYLGDGNHEEVYPDEMQNLPVCRNDREFVFARRQIRKLEGLPDEIDPRPGLGGLW